jgi:hypothetical protein
MERFHSISFKCKIHLINMEPKLMLHGNFLMVCYVFLFIILFLVEPCVFILTQCGILNNMSVWAGKHAQLNACTQNLQYTLDIITHHCVKDTYSFDS